MSISTWNKINKPDLQAATTAISAAGHHLSTCGSVTVDVTVSSDGNNASALLPFTVTKEDLNILGINAINALNFTIQINHVSLVNKITERI